MSFNAYIEELENLKLNRKPIFIDFDKIGLFASQHNVSPFLCNELGSTIAQVSEKRIEYQQMMFDKSILKKKIRHLEINQCECDEIDNLLVTN